MVWRGGNAHELVYHHPKRVRARGKLSLGETVDPPGEACGYLGMLDMSEEEVKFHVLNLGIPGVSV